MPRTRKTPPPFVVYVNFPNSTKEYVYLCNFPIVQGEEVLANKCKVTVIRTAASDPRATRYVQKVPNPRIEEILSRLREIHRELEREAALRALARKSPEAKKLLSELTRLQKEIS